MEVDEAKGQGELIQIVSFEIGAYREEEISWKVQDDTVFVVGKRISGLKGNSEARVEGGRFSRAIPIPEQVAPASIRARFVGGGLFVVEGTKKREGVKRTPSQTAYFDDAGFSVSVRVDGKVATDLGLLGGNSEMTLSSSQDGLDLSQPGGSRSSTSSQRKMPSFDSFDEDIELFFRDEPLADLLEARSNSPMIRKEQATT